MHMYMFLGYSIKLIPGVKRKDTLRYQMLCFIRRVVTYLDVFDPIDPKKVERVHLVQNTDLIDMIFAGIFNWLFGGCTSLQSRNGETILLLKTGGIYTKLIN